MAKINRAKIPKRESPWQYVLGVLVAGLGVALVGLGAWEALNNETRILVYLGGCICLSSGLSLIWLDTIRLSAAGNQPLLTANGVYLGKFKLNNYLFEAYERAANDGRREFRLVSHPPVSFAKEAAFVRYMVNEGLIEDMWPHISKQIEEDSNWAFVE
jgi:hypothetical protein